MTDHRPPTLTEQPKSPTPEHPTQKVSADFVENLIEDARIARARQHAKARHEEGTHAEEE